MMEDESISNFNMCLRDIAISSFALGEKMTKEMLVIKILRSLPKKYDMKVTVIEEAQDLSTLKGNGLIGSLQIFEVDIDGRSEKMKKDVSFVSNSQDCEDHGKKDTEKSLSNSIAFIGKSSTKL